MRWWIANKGPWSVREENRIKASARPALAESLEAFLRTGLMEVGEISQADLFRLEFTDLFYGGQSCLES